MSPARGATTGAWQQPSAQVKPQSRQPSIGQTSGETAATDRAKTPWTAQTSEGVSAWIWAVGMTTSSASTTVQTKPKRRSVFRTQ